MLTELSRQLKAQTAPGDTLICAVSGGADSVALLFGAYLLREKLGIRLEAAHFNHGLRGAESDGDEAFVEDFCRRYDIPLHVGRGTVTPGKKGLEAAAREARYAYFDTLDGKIATAHTADDNAETVLLHLVRGTGLKGLGGIAPVRGRLLRPMLNITRSQVLAFLEEYHLSCRSDSSNDTDDFLRNRLRHHVMPLLKEENPRLAENLSAMALRLRLDEEALAQAADHDTLPDIGTLRTLPPAIRARMLEQFLKRSGVKEPEAEHILLAEQLVFSENPSARGDFPGGVCISRCYNTLVRCRTPKRMPGILLSCPCSLTLTQPGLRVTCREATEIINTPHIFTVEPQGTLFLESRRPGDCITLPGGTKSLKKLFIDRKIPASQRLDIPVVRDRLGILGVYGIGADETRKATRLPAVQLIFEQT